MESIDKYIEKYTIAEKIRLTDPLKSINYYRSCIKNINKFLSNTDTYDCPNMDIIYITKEKSHRTLISIIFDIIEKPINISMYSNKNIRYIYKLIKSGNLEKFKNIFTYDVNSFLYYKNKLSPLHVCINYGDTRFITELLTLGAKIDTVDCYGYSLFEYAFIQNDPNMMAYLIDLGADVKKYTLFRKKKLYINISNEIDVALVESYILEKYVIPKDYNLKYLDWVYKYIEPYENIDIKYLNESITINTFINHLDNFLDNIENYSREDYISIIKEEMEYDLIYNLCCPINKLYILIYNLIPFIDYNDSFIMTWIVSLELKYIILHSLKIDICNFGNILKNKLKEYYLNILSRNYVQILLNQWFNKMKI